MTQERIDSGYGEHGCGCGCHGRDHVRTFRRVVRDVVPCEPKPTWQHGDMVSQFFVVAHGVVTVPAAYRVDDTGSRRVRAIATQHDGKWRPMFWEIER